MAKPKLIFTRGLPGSGKTTWAKEFVRGKEDSWARVNRDDFRQMLHDGVYIKGITENQILIARDAAITALLNRGVSVVNDDTNLPQRMARDLRSLAERVGAEWEVKDFTGVDPGLCIYYDGSRVTKHVGKEVIIDLYNRYLRGKALPLPLPEPHVDEALAAVRYIPDTSKPLAVIADIDGTVALKGARGPYEEDKIHLDRPNKPVVEAVRQYQFLGHKILFVSGRSMGCYDSTKTWLKPNVMIDGTDVEYLWMRPVGDGRQDRVVKLELFNEHIRDNFYVKAVFDDRNQVVEMWRELGLLCLQVAPGDF